MKKNKTKILILTGIFTFIFGSSFGQKISVKGNVKSVTDNTNLIGVNVRVKGLSLGTATDINGNFNLNIPVDSTIIVSYLGFQTKFVKIQKDNSVYNIVLEEDSKVLSEVIAIGYGTQKKKEVTGAVTQLSSEQLTRASSVDIGQAIQGQIAGVTVQASSGRPGEGSNIQIRGLNTVLGQNAPLFVVDGIPYDSDPMIPTSEIATIDVLKDAASASIYGTRGSGGVILITTKKGTMGTMKVRLDSYYGIQRISSDIPRMNFEEQLYSNFITAQNINNTNYSNTYTGLELNKASFLNRTDLTKIIQTQDAPVQNHSVSVSGGKDGLAYNVNANYYDQKGMLLNSAIDRFNVRANTTYKVGKWAINTGIGFRQEQQIYDSYGLLLAAYSYKPYMPSFDPSVDILNGTTGGELSNTSSLAARTKQNDRRKGDNFNGNIQANYNINKDFTYTVTAGTNISDNLRARVNPLFKTYDYLGVLQPEQQRSGVYNSNDRSTAYTFENSLRYNKKIGFHQLKGLLLYSMERYTYTSFFAQKFDLTSNDVTVLNGATLDPNVGSGNGYGQDKTNSLIGMLGRLQYDYKSRYLLSVSARRDGSSRFSKQNRWSLFPSVSLGWNVADEKFFNKISNVINEFKLRFSYGTTGNQNFLDYSNSAAIALNKDYAMGSEPSDKLLLGATQIAFANANVKWETTTQQNIGFDMAFFKNKLTLTADVYNSNKKDMLFPLLVPPTTGAGQSATVVLNVGNMTNKGIELALNYKSKGMITWNVGTTFSKNVNVVTQMTGANKTLYLAGGVVVDNIPNVDRVTVLKEGYEAGAFFVMPTNGIVKTQDQLAEYRKLVPTAQLGDLIYVDKSGDGKLDDNDRVFAGSGAPKFTLGLNSSFEYKSFDLSMQWYGSFGNNIINGNKVFAYMSQTHKDLLYQWSPENTSSPIPAFRGQFHPNVRGFADYWIEDGSFIRLKNIAFGYTIPNKISSKLKITNLRVYISAINPLTITKYTGFDPEIGNDGLSSRGIDKGSYPISSQFKTGFSLQF